ncbi:MAG TPA: hypothetical protein VM389_09245 [Phycisphaerae bacterium]|nr:hypothetical protein [Phycisphaerae bacterium]HUU22706.1 hypothetical protein [Phycisphaerae bacterium]
MTISFNCEHCGKKVQAPDSAGGRRGKCPFCKLECYIPAPIGDEEVYDLVAPDAGEEARARAEAEALRQQEMDLLSATGAREAGRPVPFEDRRNLKPEDLYHLVVNYCLDMSGSNIERAETHVDKLAPVRRTACVAVDDFLAGKVIEPALDKIPTKLLQGFLQQLKKKLS